MKDKSETACKTSSLQTRTSAFSPEQQHSVPTSFPLPVRRLPLAPRTPLHLTLLQPLLALAPLVALLELSEPTAPQVLPWDEQAALVRHHAALPGGVVVCSQEQVLLPRFDLGTFAGHVLGAHPQQLVPAADAVLSLLVDRYDVDGELPPLARLVSFQDVDLDSWRGRGGGHRVIDIPNWSLYAPQRNWEYVDKKHWISVSLTSNLTERCVLFLIPR